MLAAQSLLSGHQLIGAPPKSSSCRTPLQPKNNNQAATTISNVKPKPHRCVDDRISNKENAPHIYSTTTSTTTVQKQSPPVEPFDASLADELTAIREKLERQRIDRDKNERLLRERGSLLDLQLKDILRRGEVQKQLEIEVDRLYRLKEIRLASCMRISGIRSLRDKEQEKKMKHDQLNKAHIKTDEQKDEMPLLQTPKK